MIQEVKGSRGSIYKIDTEKMACTCKSFQFNGRRHPIDSEQRLCKHMKALFKEHPEFAPGWYQLNQQRIQEVYDSVKAELTADPDGKYRRPASFFDPFVNEIKLSISQFNKIVKFYEFCGSYRRRKDRISDLDVLVVLHQDQKPDDFLDYLENTLGYGRLWRGEKKASYDLLGNTKKSPSNVQVDFRFVPEDSWAFSVLHFTGSKSHNIEMRRRALQFGYSLSEYGLKGKDNVVSSHGCKTEKDIFDFLRMPYKEPWER